ncbi:hypothetical protein F66182_987 [Fusarium sp. NRRL 66182]|nr:hypothetical protein F66182_987 [Fusarium sp. NRRL 66182]
MAQPPSAPQTSRRRQRVESLYPRRRAVMACNVCRSRKSKCDSGRPSCSFCLQTGAVCVYEDQRSDYSNFDAASVHIINRLDSLEQSIEDRFNSLEGPSHDPARLGTPSHAPNALHYPVFETLLEWPVFQELSPLLKGQSLATVHPDDHQAFQSAAIDLLVIEPAIHHSTTQCSAASRTGLMRASSQLLLQVANPLVRDKVLITPQAVTCAVGLASSPFYPSGAIGLRDMQSPQQQQHTVQDAQPFFRKAREILSIQPPSLSLAQCHFFCGIYDMFCIRPVAAWLHFSQASLQLRLELANELRITSVGLEHLSFPYAFPQRPEESATSPSSFSLNADTGQIESWMYYLSETSLRRVGNDIVWAFYSQDCSNWTKNIPKMYSQARELCDKLDAWMHNLPSELRAAEPISESWNELGLHVRSRYLVYRSWTLRPFLYLMIHASQFDLLRYRSDVEPLACEYLASCIDIINDVTYHHRHHGTWYTSRILMSSAASIMAAARVNTITLPSEWKTEVRKGMQTVTRWTSESRNLHEGLRILEAIWATVEKL